MKTSLMSNEERRFMWNLALSFTVAHRAIAFPLYNFIRSFITYNGIFMAPGYGLGKDSIWAKKDPFDTNIRDRSCRDRVEY